MIYKRLPIEKVQKLRDSGLSYQKIADRLGVSWYVAYRVLNPKHYQRKMRIFDERYRKEHKAEIQEYRDKHKTEKAKYKKEHTAENKVWYLKHKDHLRKINKRYRRAHLPEYAAHRATRKALIVGVTVGNLAEIAEIYRRAKEDPKVRCYLCGDLIPLGHRHIDHIMPLSKGGSHRPSNLVAACDTCNLRKNDKSPEEMGILI